MHAIEAFAQKNILTHSLISHPMLVLMTPKETDGHSPLCHRLLLVMDLNRLVHGKYISKYMFLPTLNLRSTATEKRISDFCHYFK